METADSDQHQVIEAAPENVNDFISEGEEEQHVRRSSRYNKGLSPKRLITEINKVTKEINTDPATYEEAINGPNSENLILAMREEMDSLNNFGTWKICKLPLEENVIGSKWVYKTKTDQDGVVVL